MTHPFRFGVQAYSADSAAEWTAMARHAWKSAEVDHKIELRIGPAAETLRGLPNEELFDLGFIDADKTSYATYAEEILKRLRPGGLVLVDNVLWTGAVVDASRVDETTEAIRAFNQRYAADPRVDTVMLPVADGLTILRKR